MDFAKSAIANKVTTLFIVTLIIMGGILSYEKLGRLEDPEFAIKDALVVTQYPGATSQEVALEVTEKLETAIQELGQLDEIKSMSRPGVSTITVTIKDQYDKAALPQVWDELRRKVSDTQPKLPPGAGPSKVMDDYGDVYGVLLAVQGNDYSYKELEDFIDFLRRELLQVQDVAKVTVWGNQPERIFVEIERAKLAQLGVGLDVVYSTLATQNLVTSSGQVRQGDEYIKIYPSGQIASIEEIKNLVIGGGEEGLIYLKDIANVYRDYTDPPKKHLRYNQDKAIAVGISTVSGGNVVVMGEAVKRKLAELESQTPLGVSIEEMYVQSDAVTLAIDSFVVSLIQAVAIVIVVLVFFMGPMSSVIIGLSLVLTVLATFIVMYIMGINLERISLGALIIALGMLVDNAIVVVEGILIKVQKGQDKLSAATETVKQTQWPLLGATLVAILAFAAIGLSNDSTGEYTRSLFSVLLISLSLSWIIAITIVPLLCHMFFKEVKEGEGKSAENVIFRVYKKWLRFCLRLRWLTVTAVIGLLIVSVYGFAFLENSFFPDSTSNQFMVHYWLPEGTDIRRTSEDLSKLEKFVAKLEGVKSIATFVGGGAPRYLLVYSPEKEYSSYGMLLVTVDDYRTIDGLLQTIKEELNAHYLDANPKLEKIRLGPGGGFLIEGRFSGPDPNVLRSLSEQMQTIMRQDGGIIAIRDDWRERAKTIVPNFAEDKARRVGATREDLSNSLQSIYSGLDVGLYRERDDLIPITSQPPLEEREGIDDIHDSLVWSQATRQAVPLKQVIDGISTSWEDTIYHRYNKRPTITAQGDPAHGNASVPFKRIKEQVEAIPLPSGYMFEWGGEYEDSTKAQSKLMANIPVTIVLMVFITVMLFNAIRQPLIIWLTVPLAVIGVTWGLLLTNQPFGFMALLGFLSLSGMLIKNAIVLIDEIDSQIREGKEKFIAIIDAGASRLRPVGMAALTTILGMMPLLKDAFFVGMAVTIMAGLAFATILTMVIVPVFYAIFFSAKPQG